MNSLNVSIAKFAKLKPHERVLAVVVVAVLLYGVADIALLVPQQKKIKDLQRLDQAHQTELASINKTLAEMGNGMSNSSDQPSKDRAVLDELNKQIADVDAFFGRADTTTSQVGALVRELLDASPGMTLVSLKTLPVVQFYSPASKASGSDKAAKEAQKIIYRHGVEVSVKGNYMALLSYMENLQKYPKRLFWSGATLDVSVHPDAVLKLVIYTLSDQPISLLR